MSRMQENLVAFKTILYKEINRFMRVWVQSIFPPAITMTLYFVIFGKMIGSQVGDIAGFTYMQYIVPGLVMMSIITAAYTNVVFSFFSSKFQKSIEELLVSPIPNYVIIWGYVAGGVARGLLVGCIVLGVSLFFTKLHIEHWPLMIVVTLFAAVFFSLGGFINAMFARKFDDVSIVPTFVLTPLTYLGGVFYSVSLLPGMWQNVSLANPVLYIINAFRYGMIGVSDINVYLAVCMLAVFTIIMYAICAYLLHRGVGLRT